MASITQYLLQIKKAVFGKDVRDAMYNALNIINASKAEKADVQRLKNLNYYGDMDIISSPQEDFEWEVENGEAIVGRYTGNDTVVVIPYEYRVGENTYIVTRTAHSVFHSCNNLTQVIIPKSITQIGDVTFYECSSLTSVIIPKKVTNIGQYAFRGCISLEKIHIPNSVISISFDAFDECDLTRLTVICSRDSYADTYAQSKSIKTEYNTCENSFEALNDPINHRNIFRGKNLGSSVTAAQIGAIRDGSFTNLFLGDYWEIDDVNWRIVDIDYWYNTGSTAFTSHHLVIMPDTCLYNMAMNSTATTSGGYVGSDMYTSGLDTAKTIITGIFGNMVLTHKEYLVNAVTEGRSAGAVMKDSAVDLPSEIMMYGTNFYSAINDGVKLPSIYTFCKTQLALFSMAPLFIVNRENCWLRDVANAACFAYVSRYGFPNYYNADGEHGVRPVFCIG